MIITSQEEKLSGKAAFEMLSATFGVKIKIYHADNGRFAEQPFRKSIEDANQTITFCGVGYHHQNDIVKFKHSNHNTRRQNIPSTCKNILTRSNK